MEKLGNLNEKKKNIEIFEVWKQIAHNPAQYERSKRVFEIKTIQEADNLTSRVIKKYGLDPTSVPSQAIHIIDESKWPGGHAFVSLEHGDVFVCENEDVDLLKMVIIHEMFHLKGVNFLPIPLTEAIVERLTSQALNLNN